MPLYMDIHEVPGGVSAEDVAKAHAEDVKIEDKYGVHYHKYWVNEKAGKIFCLCHAPNAEAAIQVHREAHGMAQPMKEIPESGPSCSPISPSQRHSLNRWAMKRPWPYSVCTTRLCAMPCRLQAVARSSTRGWYN